MAPQRVITYSKTFGKHRNVSVTEQNTHTACPVAVWLLKPRIKTCGNVLNSPVLPDVNMVSKVKKNEAKKLMHCECIIVPVCFTYSMFQGITPAVSGTKRTKGSEREWSATRDSKRSRSNRKGAPLTRQIQCDFAYHIPTEVGVGIQRSELQVFRLFDTVVELSEFLTTGNNDTLASYGCEAWTTRTTDFSRIIAADMKFMRRTAGVTKWDHKTNDDILKELTTEPIL
ncbi:hypothetical protein ANN_21483 [Periplaneta americana]|uniref:Uncharacterized protein n=1 Tax=Periplaneta americana TaxID=6978 RepID=A0ABQ8SG62_PERAM|nr:hypothetical protein ANN_21483 [Periplaneta americana]